MLNLTKKTFNSKLGASLKKVRLEAGLSQEALADQLLLSQSSIAKIESGKRNCSAFELWSILRKCNCRESDFFYALNNYVYD